MQDCSNSIANALELLQSCTKPSMVSCTKDNQYKQTLYIKDWRWSVCRERKLCSKQHHKAASKCHVMLTKKCQDIIWPVAYDSYVTWQCHMYLYKEKKQEMRKAGKLPNFLNCLILKQVETHAELWSFLFSIVIPPASTKLKGGILVSPCPSVRLSICPSVDRIVSALYLQQYSSDPFHICTSYQATSSPSQTSGFSQNFLINLDMFFVCNIAWDIWKPWS